MNPDEMTEKELAEEIQDINRSVVEFEKIQDGLPDKQKAAETKLDYILKVYPLANALARKALEMDKALERIKSISEVLPRNGKDVICDLTYQDIHEIYRLASERATANAPERRGGE